MHPKARFVLYLYTKCMSLYRKVNVLFFTLIDGPSLLEVVALLFRC